MTIQFPSLKMRPPRAFPRTFLSVLLFAWAGGGYAQSIPHVPLPELPLSAYFLLDHQSGAVLAEQNADQRLPMASLTKIMLVYVAATRLREGLISLDDEVSVSEKAWKTMGSRMFIEVGKKVSLRDILMGIIVASGNDASIALAEHISGSEEFLVAEMNENASRMKLANTHFVDSAGLSGEDHYSSARDMAVLSSFLIRDYPEIYSWHANREYTYNQISQRNRNGLLFRDSRVDGIKTGHTEKAGYCLVASAVQEGMRLISVVMGAQSTEEREQGSKTLLNYGFHNYNTVLLYAQLQAVDSFRIWKGNLDQINVGVDLDVYITVPRRQERKYERKILVDRTLVAPVAAGQQIGTLQIRGTPEEAFRSFPLIALHDVGQGGIVRRLKDGLLLIWE